VAGSELVPDRAQDALAPAQFDGILLTRAAGSDITER
jgi:hypothetical protein